MNQPLDANDLNIAGLVPFSICDWPGHIVATVFLQGCPLRCTYCHNPALIDPRIKGEVDWKSVEALLSERAGLLDGVVFSGGEPTLQPALLPALEKTQALGYQVGLHTSGIFPTLLPKLLKHVDWVGLDVKASTQRYPAITGRVGSGAKAWQSLQILHDSGIDHEVRITVDPTVHTGEEIIELVNELTDRGEEDIVLQEVRPEGTRPDFACALRNRTLRSVLVSVPSHVQVRSTA